MVLAPMTYISLDERGVAYITGTKMKVAQIVQEKNAWGLKPEEIQAGHPHLSLAQVYAGLTYYYDHQTEIDAQITQWTEEYEAMYAAAGESPFVKRMRAEGRIS